MYMEQLSIIASISNLWYYLGELVQARREQVEKKRKSQKLNKTGPFFLKATSLCQRVGIHLYI